MQPNGLYCSRAQIIETRCVSEELNRLPRLRFGLRCWLPRNVSLLPANGLVLLASLLSSLKIQLPLGHFRLVRTPPERYPPCPPKPPVRLTT